MYLQPSRSNTALTGYSGFANFLDDFSGPSALARIDFGASTFHPNQFRQSYFFQDNWKATHALTLTLGLRYENFGQPLNAVPYPAFSGFDPARFLEPNKVNRDDNNFGPAFGLAWSPSLRSGWLGKLFGERKTVSRGGYQVSYDGYFTPSAPSLLDPQDGSFEKDLRSPYTERWSLGFERQLPDKLAASYTSKRI